MKAREQIRSLQEEGFIKETAFPGFRPPMLATLTKEYFDNPGWVYERKLDGIRCMVLKQGDKIKLLSRNKKNLKATFPELQEQLPSLSKQLLKDCLSWSGHIRYTPYRKEKGKKYLDVACSKG